MAKLRHDPFTPHMALHVAQVSGKVTYNDRELDRFVVHRTAAFMDQQDEHIPCLTVRETLNFSARCQGSGQRPGGAISSCLALSTMISARAQGLLLARQFGLIYACKHHLTLGCLPGQKDS